MKEWLDEMLEKWVGRVSHFLEDLVSCHSPKGFMRWLTEVLLGEERCVVPACVKVSSRRRMSA